MLHATATAQRLTPATEQVSVVTRFKRRARFALGSRLGARKIRGVAGRVHFNDLAWRQAGQTAYRAEAAWFAALIGEALRKSGRDWSRVSFALEIGCGYGRITRELARHVRPGGLAVCDLIPEAARFAANEFGARHVPILEETAPGRRHYDLIVAASVYPTLDRPMIEMNLAKAATLLRPEGILVFSTQGGPIHASDSDYEEALNAALFQDGFAFQPTDDPYIYDGESFIEAKTVTLMMQSLAPDLELVLHDPRTFGGTEDVFAYRKRF